jgi:dTDP-4-dehydrorhamnose 3,5-epimerase
MNIIETEIPDLLIIEPKVFGDQRGYFFESYSKSRYQEGGIVDDFIQDNVSFSKKGILRGLHCQKGPSAQGKLVQVLLGEVYDVAVDIRPKSPTFGKWVGILLSAENKKQFWIPPGLAHGFLVTSEEAIFSYKCTKYYDPSSEFTLAYNDPTLNIPWPLKDVKLSEKDRQGISLSELLKQER